MKKELTSEQMYKKNRKKAKLLKSLSLPVFYLLLSLALVFAILALSNSVGNLTEITDLLDEDKYTGAQITEHYTQLTEKWGVWKISSVGGVSIEYVNIKNAMFNGLSITYVVLFVISLALAFIIGKLVLPMLGEQYENNNEQLVDLATLQTQESVKEIKKGDWF